MKTAYRKTLRDVWRDKGRTILVVLSIAVGVFAVGLVSAMNEIMPANMARSFRESNPAHITFSVSGLIDDDALRGLARVAGVADVEGELHTTVRWRPGPDTPWRDAPLIVRDDFTRQKLDRVELLAGQWPDDHEVAVEHNAVGFFGIPVGGSITISIGDNVRTVPVSGAVRDLQSFPPQFGGDAAFYANREFAAWLLGARNFNRVKAQVPHFTQQSADDAAVALKERLLKIGYRSGTPEIQNPHEHFFQETVDTVILILGVMAVLSLALGLFLVVNTIHAILAQQVSQIGVMKAVGAMTGQVARLYLAGVAMYGALALVIALPLGGLAAHALSGALLWLLNISIEPFRFSATAVWQQIGTALIVPALAALWPIVSGARVTVREAIASYGIGLDYGASLFDRLLARVRGLPRPLMLTLRNTFRRKARVALTQITLTIAGLVFIMVVSLGQSLNHTLDTFIDTLGLDVALFFSEDVRVDEAEALINRQTGVEQAEMWLVRSGAAKRRADDVAGKRIVLRAVPPDTRLYQPSIVRGRWLHPQDGHALVINQALAGDLGVSVGDTLVVELGDERVIEWTIVGAVFDLSSNQAASYVPRDVLLRDIGRVGRTSVAWMRTTQHDSAFQLRVASQLRDLFQARGITVGGTLTAGEIAESNRSQFNILLTLLLVMSGLIALVGSIGLAGTLSINVLERRREIGVMRAIGASSWSVAALFVGEGILLGLIAWAAAVPLSAPGGYLFASAIAGALEVPMVYQFSWNGAAIWLAIVLTLSIVASSVPALRATRLSVRESLAYE